MRKHKKIIAVTALLLHLFSLSACSNTETQFTQAEQTTAATVPAATVEQSPATLYEKKGVFTSKDGTVEFTWNISDLVPFGYFSRSFASVSFDIVFIFSPSLLLLKQSSRLLSNRCRFPLHPLCLPL